MKVLFVCTGNLCRSPMAEAMLRYELSRRGCAEVEVASVGTWAYRGSPASEVATAVLWERGLDLSIHQARPIEDEDVMSADIVVAMTSVHEREVLDAFPESAGRVVLMKELAEIEVAPLWPGATREDRVKGLLQGRRPPRRRSLDVDDPIGLPSFAYERVAGEIQIGIRVLADILCETRRG